jgi:hypothetical protein
VLYSTVISWTNNQIRQETQRLAESQARLHELSRQFRETQLQDEKWARQAARLEQWKARLPQGAAYAWLLKEMEPVAKTNGVAEFALGQVSPAEHSFPTDLSFVGLKGSLSGEGFYQHLGKFVADLENAFPFNEVTFLNIDAASSITGLIDGEDQNYMLGMELEFFGCGYDAVFQ